MHARIAEVLDYITKERAALRASVDGVPPALRETRPAPERWSVAEVLEHLLVVETRVAALFGKLVAEARANGLGPDPHTTPIVPTVDLRRLLDRDTAIAAPGALHPSSAIDADAAWSALERSRETLRATVMSADGLDLASLTWTHLVLGPSTLYQWVVFVGGHEARHAAQIREIGVLLAA